jgi:hypothetical protein
MKAKFGKISIGCFIVYWVYMGYVAKFVGRCDAPGHIILASLLAQPSGVITAIIGAIRGESPKWYYSLGLLLNLGVIVWILNLIFDFI